MDLSVIVVSFNSKNMLRECLMSLRRIDRRIEKEVIVVDNASSDGSADMVAEVFPSALIIRNKINKGFSAANNQGIRIAKGRYILLLNPDAFLANDGMSDALDFMDKNKSIGILGAQIIDTEGNNVVSSHLFLNPWELFILKIQKIHKFLPSAKFNRIKDYFGKRKNIKNIFEADWIPGCFFLIKKEVIEDIGLLDEDYFLYSEEKDYCFRAKKKNWKIICFPKLKIEHIKGSSTKRTYNMLFLKDDIEEFYAKSEYLFYKKHYNMFTVFEKYFLDLLYTFISIIKDIRNLARLNIYINLVIVYTLAFKFVLSKHE